MKRALIIAAASLSLGVAPVVPLAAGSDTPAATAQAISTGEARFLSRLAPSSHLDTPTRTRLLSSGYRVCEAVTGGVPIPTVVQDLINQGYTSSEAKRLQAAARTELC